MDLVAVYLTAAEGYGQVMRLATIDRKLADLPLRQSLMLLSEMCFRVESASPTDTDAHVEFAERALPKPAILRAVARLRRPYPPTIALSPQAIVLLGIRLMSVSDGSAAEESDPETLARKLGGLCLALSDHIDSGELTNETTILEFVRLGLFYSSNEHPGWLSLAGRLFFDVLPTLSTHSDWMDPHARFEAGTGLKLDMFWALTCAQGAEAAHSADNFMFPMNVANVSKAQIEAWKSLLSATLTDAAEAARADMRQPLGWSMSAVWKRPIIDLGEGRGPVLRPRLLQMQAEPAQMFWHIRDVLVNQGVDHNQWSRLHGSAVEELGLQLLYETHSPDVVLDERAFVARWAIPASSKRADAVIVTEGRDLVVIDFVGRQLTAATTTTGDFAALTKDLRVGVSEKLEQIDATLKAAKSMENGWRRFYPIVVSAGPMPYIPPLDDAVNDELAATLQVINNDPRFRRWMAMDLLNFQLLLNVSRHERRTVPETIEAWQSSALARNTFREWALRDGPASHMPGGGLPADWQRRVLAYIGQS